MAIEWESIDEPCVISTDPSEKQEVCSFPHSMVQCISYITVTIGHFKDAVPYTPPKSTKPSLWELSPESCS